MEQIKKVQTEETTVICIHCNKKIDMTKIIGISLICPFCGKPSDRLSDKAFLK